MGDSVTPSSWLLVGKWCGLVLVGMLFWSSRIGDDPSVPDEPPPPPAQTRSGSKATSAASGRPSVPRELLPVDPDGGLDRRTFMLAFQRQADLALIACLKAWEVSPGSVAVSAVLDQQGQLRHLNSLDPARPLPSCAEEAITAMHFAASGRQLQRPTLVLQWRIDW